MVVGEFTQEADVVIIGGGPGGYSAAFRAAELGASVTIVDDRPALGGVCLHEGCIPSKTLLYAVQLLRNAKRASAFGIEFGEPKLNINTLRAAVQQTVDQLAKGLAGLCRKHKIELITGTAHFDDSRSLTVANGNITRLRFRRAVIATGSTATAHDKLPFDLPGVLSPAAAMRLENIPKTMLVVGDDYKAVEIASIYAGLGCEVTLVTERGRILADADDDIIRPLARALSEELTEMCTEVQIESVEASGERVKVAMSGATKPSRDTFDAVVATAGQQANVSSLRLEKTSVRVGEDGFIEVQDQLRTSDARIFAVGDVTGRELLADKAIAQGRVCGEVLAGWDSYYDARVVPMVVFTDPNVAWCGLTETAAKEQGRAIAIKKMPWGASGRAAGMRRTEGMTKLICEEDSEFVLGVGIVGTNAAEMIGEAALAIEMGATITDLAATIHPHPTTCELLSDAARQ